MLFLLGNFRDRQRRIESSTVEFEPSTLFGWFCVLPVVSIVTKFCTLYFRASVRGTQFWTIVLLNVWPQRLLKPHYGQRYVWTIVQCRRFLSVVHSSFLPQRSAKRAKRRGGAQRLRIIINANDPSTCRERLSR